MANDPELQRLENEVRDARTARAALMRRAGDDSAIARDPKFIAEFEAAEARLNAASAALVAYRAGR